MYPRMLFRPGDALEWQGLSLDTRIVADAEDEATALKEGWKRIDMILDPLDHDGDGRKGGSLPARRGKKAGQ